MSEKMLVTQALDERDLLVKKIGDKIQKIQAVDTKKRNEEKTVTARVSPEEFGGAASAAYQRIMDLIDRYMSCFTQGESCIWLNWQRRLEN